MVCTSIPSLHECADTHLLPARLPKELDPKGLVTYTVEQEDGFSDWAWLNSVVRQKSSS